jgi:hypothetical protein
VLFGKTVAEFSPLARQSELLSLGSLLLPRLSRKSMSLVAVVLAHRLMLPPFDSLSGGRRVGGRAR